MSWAKVGAAPVPADGVDPEAGAVGEVEAGEEEPAAGEGAEVGGGPSSSSRPYE